MSIIQDALRMAEKTKAASVVSSAESKEYLQKSIGPERRSIMPAVRPAAAPVQSKKASLLPYGMLLSAAIVFLSLANIYIFSRLDAGSKAAGTEASASMPAKAEAYTDIKNVVSLVEGTAKARRNKRTFLSDFKLNGIVQDKAGAQALVNGRLVRVGDNINGAIVVSILPDRVILNLNEEFLDLRIK